MAEYIEREVAIEKTEAFCDVFVTKWTDEKVIAWIKSLPVAADVVEVVHGEWISHEGYEECNICHHKAMFEHNYCPNCGSRMDGGNNG